MGSLEQSVRRSFAAAAGDMPAVLPDPADRAIRRARRVRRWQASSGVLAVAVATVVAGGGAAALRNGREAAIGLAPALTSPAGTEQVAVTGTASAVLTRAAVDVVAGNTLLARSGGQVDLSLAGEVTAVYETPGGWLVIGTGASGSPTADASGSPTAGASGSPTAGASGIGGAGAPGVWFANAAGSLTPVLSAPVGAIAVEPGGKRLAWRDADRLATTTVADGRLGQPVETPVPAGVVPAGVVPVGFAGDAVRLGRAGAVATGQDLWFAGRGGYSPHWTDSVTGVYGPLSNGQLVGQVLAGNGGDERCLALVRPTDLQPTKVACGLGLAAEARGWLSPGDRWLVVEVSAAGGNQGALIDLSAVFGGDTRTVGVGAAPLGGAAWEDSDTVVRAAAGQLERLRLDRLWTGTAGAVEPVEVPGVRLGSRLLVVTRLPS